MKNSMKKVLVTGLALTSIVNTTGIHAIEEPVNTNVDDTDKVETNKVMTLEEGTVITSKGINTQSVITGSTYLNEDKTLYFKDGSLLTIKANSEECKVNKVYVKNGNALVKESDTSELTIELNKDDTFLKNCKVFVEATKGEESVVFEEDLLKYFSGIEDIKPDVEKVSIVGNISGSKNSEGYNDVIVGSYTLSSEVGLNEDLLSVSAGGAQVAYKISDNEDGTTSLDFNVNTEDLKEGKNTLTITAVNKLGTETVYKEELNVSKINVPFEVNVSFQGSHGVSNDTLYISESSSIELTTEEEGTDDTYLAILKDGEEVVTNKDTTVINYLLQESGTYTVKNVVNGEETIYNLSDISTDLVNTVVLDTDNPTMTVLVDGLDLTIAKTMWFTKPEIVITPNDDTKLLKLKAIINGVEQESKAENGQPITIMTSAYTPNEDGTLNIELILTDASNKEYKEEFTLLIDNEKPVIDSIEKEGVVTEKDGVFYSNKQISITGKVKDLAGIQDFKLRDEDSGAEEVFQLKDGEFTATIKRSGNYSLIAIDVLAHKTVLSLGNFVIDTELPIITPNYGVPAYEDEDGVNWFMSGSNLDLDFDVSDENLKDVEVTVDDNPVDASLENGKVNISLEGTGVHTVKIVASDLAGNSFTYQDKFGIDDGEYDITLGDTSGKYSVSDQGVFVSDSFKFKVNVENSESGIKSIKVMADGTELSKSSGYYVINSDYNDVAIIVTDNCGDERTVYLEELLGGSQSDDVFIDNGSPKYSVVSAPEDDDWYTDSVSYTIKFTDDKSLKNIKVNINGENTVNWKSSKITKEHTVTADVSEAKQNEDGSYNIEIVATDNLGNKTTWTKTVYVDNTMPTISKFVFSGDGIKEGAEIDGSKDKYGFFFKDDATCDIYVEDGTISSGVTSVRYTLISADGSKEEGTAEVKGNVARVDIPKNFKGHIEAYAVDKAGNIGDSNLADGVITEDKTWYINTSKIDMNMPTTSNKDNGGLDLYNSDVETNILVEQNASGIKHLSWGVNDSTLGEISVDENGKVTGDSAGVVNTDKNLVLSLNKLFSVTNNENNLNVWVKVEDRAGNTSESSRKISIDKDKPVINVTYNQSNESTYYNSDRVATITIDERNFKATDVKLAGDYGSVSDWKNVDGKWVSTLTFNKDGNYQFAINYTDLAGNEAEPYKSEKFTIDKTAPKLSVTFDNNNVRNDKYYNEARTATIKVVDENFDRNDITLTGEGNLGAWSGEDGTSVNAISYSKDGDYNFSVKVKDKAGNESEVFESGDFVIDTTEPKLTLTGVSEGASYKDKFSGVVSVSDDNLDSKESSVKLHSTKNNGVSYQGKFTENSGTFEIENLPKEEKYDDAYIIEADAVDLAGNHMKESVNFTVNRFGSRFRLLTEDLLGQYLQVPKDVVIQEESVDKTDMEKAKVEITLDGEKYPVDDSLVSIKETGKVGNWKYLYTINKDAFKDNGRYIVKIYSQSLDGTVNSNQKEEYQFIVDNEKPEINIFGINSFGFYNDTNKKVTVDIRDISDLKKVSFKLNGESLDVEKGTDGKYYIDIPEKQGQQSLEVTAVDKAGNIGEASVNNFVVSTNILGVIMNSTWLKVLIGVVFALIVSLLGFIFYKRKKVHEYEDTIARESAKVYKDSSSKKDEVKNLDENE